MNTEIDKRRGSAPSSVSAAVLCIEGIGVLLATPLFGLDAEARAVFILPFVLAAIFLTSFLLTVFYVLPVVIFGHWLGNHRGAVKRWQWVLLANACGAPLVTGVTLLFSLFYNEGDFLNSWGSALGWFIFLIILYSASAPAVLVAHATVVRAENGNPVQLVGKILKFGSLALLIELMAILVFLEFID
ncbi:hypothetical protein [Streptomyces sp. HB2AG]|uniref:hypothetical protein n=1 Tax=Streptomyces sp. HB2AG TaxID=2983400 RepID=UPI0022AA19B3|nr:hypothetical protein [Streptomyces sp. HB2AG]MCZ2525925.1 hypothetical protein [Streptomyces sp. HB2AG]